MFCRGFCLLLPPPLLIKARSFLSSPLISLGPSLSMDSKHDGEGLVRGGCSAPCTCSNERRKVAAVLIIQSLLTAMCAAISLYIFFNQNTGSNKQHDKGIYLHKIGGTELRFDALWNQSVNLQHEKKLVLSCGGPYLVYLWACVRSFGAAEGTANLTMHQGSKSIHLKTMRGNSCQETQSTVMLSNQYDVTFKLEQSDIDIEDLHLGLHYMLGAQCFHSPISEEHWD